MPSLVEYQARMSAHLRGAGDAVDLFATSGLSIEDGLEIYRGNVEAAAYNALRLAFPTVDRLVGEAFFNQLCARRLRLDPPKSGCLSDYCSQFPHFLHAVEHLHRLPYLVEVARFDLELERVANADRRQRSPRIALNGAAVLVFESTIRCITLRYPVDEIRTALETDEKVLPHIDLAKRVRWRVLWRGARGVELRVLSESSGLFLSAVLAGRGLEHALERAADSSAADVAGDIERDIMRAPFVRILAATE